MTTEFLKQSFFTSFFFLHQQLSAKAKQQRMNWKNKLEENEEAETKKKLK